MAAPERGRKARSLCVNAAAVLGCTRTRKKGAVTALLTQQPCLAARKAGTRPHETHQRPTRCPLRTRASPQRPKQCPLEPRPAPPAVGKRPLGTHPAPPAIGKRALATQVVPNGPKRCPLRTNGRHLGHRQGNLVPRLHHLLRSSAISRRDCAKRYEGVCFPKRVKARYGPTGCPIRSETARRGPTG